MALNFKNLSDKLGKLSKKVKAKNEEGEEVEIIDEGDDSDRTRTEQVDLSELKKSKPKLKSIHILIIILLVLFLLIDDDWVSNQTPEIVKTTIDQVNNTANQIRNKVPSTVPNVEVNKTKDRVNNENVLNPEIISETTNAEDIKNEVLDSTAEQNDDIAEEVPAVEEKMEVPPLTTITEGEQASSESTENLNNVDDNISEEVNEEANLANNNSDQIKNDVDIDNSSLENEPIQNPQELSDKELLEKVNSGGPTEEEASFDEMAVTNEIISESGGTDKLLKQIEQELKQEKLLQKDLDYRIKNHPPPAYDIRGPALVRNCVGGHWACVDAPSFKQCKTNFDWAKEKGRKIQCFPHQVYKTLQDCEMAQDNVMIDPIKSAEVCQY